MANVEIWMSQNMNPPPKTAFAISETTETVSLGTRVRSAAPATPSP